MYVVALFVRMLVDLQRNGSDSKTYQPSAYVRGTVVTFKAEAADITAKGTNHGVLAHKSVPVALKGASVKQKLLQLHALSKARTSKLAMMDGETRPKCPRDVMCGMTCCCRGAWFGRVAGAQGSVLTWVCVLLCVRARAVADISTINDIHAAYIHGSVPTAKNEADDIMALNFPDEVLPGL
jgi:hypothetical protein